MRKALFFFCLLSLAGCLRLERDYPEREFYALEVSRPQTPPASMSLEPLRVSKFRVTSPLAGKAFVYRTADLKYQEDFYNRFVASPGELLAAQTVRWLTAASLFKAVYGGPSPVEPKYFLEGEVSALYGDFRRGPARAVLEIVFTATRGDGASEILMHRTYRKEAVLPEGNSTALAAGWSEALGEILGELERDLRGVAVREGEPRVK